MKKTLATLFVLLALLLSGCSAKKDVVTATTPPATTQDSMTFPDALPSPTGVLPQMQDGMNQMLDGMTLDPVASPTTMPKDTGVTSMDTARRVAEQVEDELERLSEVDDAEVVIAGNRAAVALEFDDQYQGGIDDRLKQMVRERIGSVVSGVTEISITADATLLDEIEALGERLSTMTDMTALRNDLDVLLRKIGGA